MRIPGRVLLVALFAASTYLPIVIAQDPNSVNLRPRAASAQPGVTAVQVTVDRNRVPLGDDVTFYVSPASIVTNPRFTVTIYFGDGTQKEMHDAQTPHLYNAPGTYTYSVLVKPSQVPQPTPSKPGVPSITLYANPTTVAANGSVNFTAQLSNSYPNLKYRFVFADGAQTDWQDAARTSHVYSAPKTYLAYVDIAEASGGFLKRLGGSPRQPIQVTPARPISVPTPSPVRPPPSNPSSLPPPSRSPTPLPSPVGPTPSPTASPIASPSPGPMLSWSPAPTAAPSASPAAALRGRFDLSKNWWKYLLLLLLLLVVYRVGKFFFAPRPKFVPRLDPGVSRVGSGPLGFDFQLLLNRNSSESEYGIGAGGGSLIKTEKRIPWLNK